MESDSDPWESYQYMDPRDRMDSFSLKVWKRVQALKFFQSQHDEFVGKFSEERAALEDKYQKLYASLYTKRYDIVNGLVEVEGSTNKNAEGTLAKDTATEDKGIPDFWLTAMKTNDKVAWKIQERDEEALKFLKDIKWCKIDKPKGFKLEFFFDANPFFKNSVLTKIFHIIYDEEELVIKHMIGTEIDWLTGKCLNQELMGKRPRNGSYIKPITKNCRSFFNFFNPPRFLKTHDVNEYSVSQLYCEKKQDYDIGSTIKDKIIPHAVLCFLGEAIPEDNFGRLKEDEDVDEYEEECKTKRKNKLQKHSDILESLNPRVWKRIDALKQNQCQHDELEAKFSTESAALEAKYHKIYEALYTKRYDIVNGVVDVEGSTNDIMKFRKFIYREMTSEDTATEEKGVPHFWLNAIKTNELLAEEIQERDEEVLKFLKDIKCCRIDNPKGFKLEFFFDANPFFKNYALTKIFHITDEKELIIERTIGTEIEWLNQEGSNANTITRYCDSFFNFFDPPRDTEDSYVDEDSSTDSQDTLQDERKQEYDKDEMQQEYDIGSTIRDKIIPHAVSWFLGEVYYGRSMDDEVEYDDWEGIADEDEDGDKEESNTKRKKSEVNDDTHADHPPERKQE